MISENVNRPYSTNKHVFSFLWGETDFSVYAFNSRNQLRFEFRKMQFSVYIFRLSYKWEELYCHAVWTSRASSLVPLDWLIRVRPYWELNKGLVKNNLELIEL
jgi:hypothetical protein